MTRLEALLSTAQGTSVPIPYEGHSQGDPVFPEGPLEAKIAIVGESLGWEEHTQRRNFVGKSGGKLRGWMRWAGIHPDHCRILNVYPFFPPGGSITNVTAEELSRW